ADLHWLVHQGHVIEFADGRLETAKKPAPRPPKPEKKPVAEKPVAEGETISATEPVSAAEVAAAPAAEIQTPTAESAAPFEAQVPAAESVVTPPDGTSEEAVESPS
ncbi:MAG TPA: hypothetical protein VKS19_10805, partial [Verrucomicrobiae bacterium]|nr:hypothetical protein [Verrucomicrobiae bacterium]